MDSVIRVVIVYLVLMIGFRVMGKRDLGDLSPFELVMLLIIPEIFSQSLHNNDSSLTNAIIQLCTLFTLVFLTSILTYFSKKAQKAVETPPTVIISHGKLLEKALDKELVSPEELYGEMHKVGLKDISEVEWALLETDGKFSFIPVEEKRLLQRAPTHTTID